MKQFNNAVKALKIQVKSFKLINEQVNWLLQLLHIAS